MTIQMMDACIRICSGDLCKVMHIFPMVVQSGVLLLKGLILNKRSDNTTTQ